MFLFNQTNTMTTVNKEDSTSAVPRSAFQELLLELSLLSDFVLTQVHICIPGWP